MRRDHRRDGLIASQRLEQPLGEPVDSRAIHGGNYGNYNEAMPAVRYLALAALVVWLGGMGLG